MKTTTTETKRSEAQHTPGQLTKAQRAAMSAVKDGADVYCYTTALRLREVESAYPAFIDIGRAMNAPEDGAVRQPYFGAILTAAGKAAIARAEGQDG